MKIVCLVKLVPDVESFKYDAGRGVLLRDNAHQLINPDDGTALAFALELARADPSVEIETLTLGPASVRPHLEDMVRRGARRAVLITDPLYAGSDTYASSRILARCLQRRAWDLIFSGTRTLDGGTSHVPAQIAEILGLEYLGDVVAFAFRQDAELAVDVDGDDGTLKFALDLPAAMGFRYATKRKLPYIPRDAVDADVAERIETLTNRDLDFAPGEVGLAGSLTAVSRVEVKAPQERDTRFVGADAAGIEEVYGFLVDKGYLA